MMFVACCVQERADKIEQNRTTQRKLKAGARGSLGSDEMSTARAYREGITQGECVRGEGAF